MISKEQFVGALMHELNVIRHLGEKVTPEMLAYRPSDKQRTTLELMQYLGQIFLTITKMAAAKDTSIYAALSEAAPTVTLENFDEVMTKQAETVNEELMALRDEDFKQDFAMFGTTQSLALHLLILLKIASAYKTQLFLYLKANGMHDIGTMNLWAGMDMPAQG